MVEQKRNRIKYLSDQFKKDPFYAYTWHCGVAMAFFDTIDIDIDWKGILDDN